MLLERGLERIGEAGVVGEELESVGRSQLEGKLEGVSWKSVGVSWCQLEVSWKESWKESVVGIGWNWAKAGLLTEQEVCRVRLGGNSTRCSCPGSGCMSKEVRSRNWIGAWKPGPGWRWPGVGRIE